METLFPGGLQIQCFGTRLKLFLTHMQEHHMFQITFKASGSNMFGKLLLAVSMENICFDTNRGPCLPYMHEHHMFYDTLGASGNQVELF